MISYMICKLMYVSYMRIWTNADMKLCGYELQINVWSIELMRNTYPLTSAFRGLVQSIERSTSVILKHQNSDTNSDTVAKMMIQKWRPLTILPIELYCNGCIGWSFIHKKNFILFCLGCLTTRVRDSFQWRDSEQSWRRWTRTSLRMSWMTSSLRWVEDDDVGTTN